MDKAAIATVHETAASSRDSDVHILNALQGVKCSQNNIRQGRTERVLELIRYYQELPEDVTRRLSKLTPEIIKRAHAPPGREPSAEIIQELTCDEATEQVIRATNTYRARLGYGLLGPDGWPDVVTSILRL